MRRSFFPKFIEICVGAHPDGHQHGGRKSTKTSVTEFCYKRGNLSLEELEDDLNNTFSKTRTVQMPKFPEISPEKSPFFKHLGFHVNAASRKSLEIQL